MKDTDIMPFGVHRGKALINVPDAYFIYMYDYRREFLQNAYPEILKYILDNAEVLKIKK